MHPDRLQTAGDIDPIIGNRRQVLEALVPITYFHIVGIGERPICGARLRMQHSDHHQPLRILVRIGAEEHRVHDTEESRVGADTEGEGEDRRGGESRAA